MLKLNNKLIAASATLALTSALFMTGCTGNGYNGTKDALDGGMTYPRENGVETAYSYNTQDMSGLNYGRVPTKNELAAWDMDMMPDGTGYPEGSGSVEEGDELYEAQCASCHGEFAAGGKGYPTLAGGLDVPLTNQRTCPGKDAPKRTFGSYWPQVSTLMWYIRDAMPYAHPKSFTNDQLYAMTAYLLAANEITIDGEELDDEYVLNKEKLMKVKMPNREGFYPNIDGPEGVENVRKFFQKRENYGAVGTRCMTDCGKEKVMRIGMEIANVVPAYSTKRDLPVETGVSAKSPTEKLYDANCALCHTTDAMGAPAVGDHDTWATVVAQGMDTVNSNAINGFGGMPAKGGNMDLTDAQVIDIVKFMVDSSK